MPELPDIAAYLGALNERIVGERLERVRIGSEKALNEMVGDCGLLREDQCGNTWFVVRFKKSLGRALRSNTYVSDYRKS